MERDKETFPTKNNASLIIRGGQILAVFIAMALTGMISSILVSESINANVTKINMAGSLQILAARIPAPHSRAGAVFPEQEVNNFQKQLDMIQNKSRLVLKSDSKLATLFSKIKQKWSRIKKQQDTAEQREQFSKDIDSLVGYFQKKTEKEIQLLRIIQYLGLFVMVFISYVTIYRSQGGLITPFKRLIRVATEAGLGNFTPQADESAKGELGQLAISLNEMTRQLSLTYQDFERNVAHKTAALEQSNRSLSILYRSAHSLSSGEQSNDLNQLLSDLSQTLGSGTITVNLVENNKPTQAPLANENRPTQHLYPIDKHGHCFGVLAWENRLKPEAWQEKLLKAMTNLIATSIDLEHKRRTESRLEIMEERAVIARELHDSLAQSLSYLKLQISLLNKQYQKGLSQEQISSTISEISKGTNQAYKQLREILTTFRLKLDNDSIENSIQEAVSEFSEKCHYTIGLHYSLDNNALKPHQEIHLLQIIREALSNIHKHAQATAAIVNILIDDNEVQVEVTDNGCGQPESTSKEGHFGLKIMNERAKSLGGTLDIIQNNPCGTRVSLHFKINSDSK